jgi:hypothetical protein
MKQTQRPSSPSLFSFRRHWRLPFLLSAALFSGILCSVPGALFGADDAIVLEESQIFGKSLPSENKPGAASSDRPALSTAFPWDGEAQANFNIPEEILNELTQPDPSYLSGEAAESAEEERVKGD